MAGKKDRERVIAEITLSHLIRLGNEQGCPVSRQQALIFLNQEGRAFEMWKHMMQAAEEFIASSLFQHSFSPGGHNEFASRPRPERSISTAAHWRHSVLTAPIFQQICRQGRLSVAVAR